MGSTAWSLVIVIGAIGVAIIMWGGKDDDEYNTSLDQSETSDCGASSHLYAYRKGCRCDVCRKVRSEYMKGRRSRYDGERRIGKRADQKRAWDRRNRRKGGGGYDDE